MKTRAKIKYIIIGMLLMAIICSVIVPVIAANMTKQLNAYYKDIKIVITTDHGTIRVNNAIKVVGDRNTTTNLRYKTGKNLNYNPKEVFSIKFPEKVGLTSLNLSSSYIFAGNDDFFAYPNNFNHYATYYKGTFQHGGISLEEMLIPIVTLRAKRGQLN